jgi:hypothetical protein
MWSLWQALVGLALAEFFGVHEAIPKLPVTKVRLWPTCDGRLSELVAPSRPFRVWT